MISKVFFTMLVIIIVGMIFRNKAQKPAQNTPSKNQHAKPSLDENSQNLSPKSLAYLIIALLMAASMTIFYFNWSDANQLIHLRVINASGGVSDYQAYQKNINGRHFTDLSGTQIRLADSDRLELLPSE